MGLPTAIIAEATKFVVTFLLLETSSLDDLHPITKQLVWEQAAKTKVQKDYNTTLTYIEAPLDWSKVSSTKGVHVWKRWDDSFKDTVHKFQVTCNARPEIVKEIVGDVKSWPNWFRLIEEVDILAKVNEELSIASAQVIGVSSILNPRALLSGVYTKDDPKSPGGFLMLLADVDWPQKEDEMRQHVRLKTNVIAIRGEPLPAVKANEIDDDGPRTSVEFYFSAEFGLSSFIPKAVIFRVFVPLVRRSALSLQAMAEARQKELDSKYA